MSSFFDVFICLADLAINLDIIFTEIYSKINLHLVIYDPVGVKIDLKFIQKQESPPAWTQDLYLPPLIKYSMGGLIRECGRGPHS